MINLLTPPTVAPVTLDEAKAAARIDGDAFDLVVPGLVMAALGVAEHETDRQFIAQTWREELADWPAVADFIQIHQPTVLAITYWSSGNTWATLATNAYTFFPAGPQGVWTGIAPVLGTSWPALGQVAGGPRVRVDLTAGAASGAGVPEAIKLFIRAQVAYWINNPEAATTQKREPAPLLASLLDAWRLCA